MLNNYLFNIKNYLIISYHWLITNGHIIYERLPAVIATPQTENNADNIWKQQIGCYERRHIFYAKEKININDPTVITILEKQFDATIKRIFHTIHNQYIYIYIYNNWMSNLGTSYCCRDYFYYE